MPEAQNEATNQSVREVLVLHGPYGIERLMFRRGKIINLPEQYWRREIE
jgi:hypothetical protein